MTPPPSSPPAAARQGTASALLAPLLPLALMVFLALWPALACGRTQLASTRPHATVTPATLDFGKTPLLFAAQKTLQLGDGGNAALHLHVAQLTGAGAAAFAVAALSGAIAPGDTVDLAVTFTPTAAGVQHAQLELATDDPDLQLIAVPLSGEGIVSGVLVVAPAALDFGRVGEGQTVSRELLLRSLGTDDLFLASIGFSTSTPDAFGLVGSAHAPATLPAGQSALLAVRFSPLPATPAGVGALELVSSDPLHTRVQVPLTAAINRAPLPLAQGSVGGDPLQTGTLTTAAGATVDLDGAGSTDPDGDLPLHLAWSLALRPEGSAAAVANPTQARTQLVLDRPGVYSVLLGAVDATGLPSLAPSRLDLRALPPQQLVATLVWDQERPDLDLHLLLPGAQPGSPGDCGWTNPDPVWFDGGADANPHHLGDRLVGYGPETVQWKQPAAGTYRISVTYKSANGLSPPAVTARVRVAAFGVVVAELEQLLATPGESWAAGTVDWPTGKVTAGGPDGGAGP